MASHQNPNAMIKRFEKLDDGLKRKLPGNVEKIVIRGVETPLPTLKAKLAEYRALYSRPIDLRIDLDEAIAKRTKMHPRVMEYLDDVQAAVVPYLGRRNPELKAFGYPCKKNPKRMTSKQKVTKAERARKTRELNHTMGKRQKKNFKAGNEPPPEKKPPSAS